MAKLRIKNLGLAVFLRYHNVDPIDLEWEDRTCWWHYDDSDLLQSLIHTYRKDEGMVEPKRYMNVHYGLKDEMFKAQREQIGRRPHAAVSGIEVIED